LRAGDFFIFVPCTDRGDEDSFYARLEDLKQEFQTSMERIRRLQQLDHQKLASENL